jgi:PAS domain S-box-containing protein
MQEPDGKPKDPKGVVKAEWQREAIFRLLVESVHEYAVFALDAQGHVVSWNPGAERLKGYRPQEILGQHFSRFYPPEKSRADVDRGLEVALREGVYREEGWRIRKDGVRFWADVTIAPIRDHDGSLRGFAKVTRDMTQRKQAEEHKLELAREQAVRARLEAHNEVSRALAEAPLEVGAVAQVMVREVVEQLGDGSLLCRVREDGMEILALHHPDAAARRLMEDLAADPLQLGAAMRQAVRTGAAVLWSGPDLERLPAAAASLREPSAEPGLRERFAAASVLAVPMTLPGRAVIGAWALVRTGPGRSSYTEEDRLFVESLASRSALALSNAQMYAESHAAHEQLRLIFQGIAEGILVQGPDGRIVVANDTGARMCGFENAAQFMAAPVSEVLERFEIFDEQGNPFPLEQLPARRALRGEERVEAVLRSRVRGTALERWSVSKATPLRDREGEIVYAISIFEDITERRRVFERLRFLSDAGELLGTLRAYEQILETVAELAVPRIADACVVHVLDEQGKVRRLASAHVDPRRSGWAEALEGHYPVSLDAPAGIGAVLRTGVAQLYSQVTDALIQARATDPEHLRLLRELAPRSSICVPLVARRRTIGALTLITTNDSGRSYDEQDLTTAELLGRRVGLAVENARLHAETQAALQQVTEISRTKDEFLATLSHELRTPLNSIVGWAHLLKSGGLDADLARKAVETIDRNAALQSQLIADILDVSRIITGKVRLNVRPIEPLTVIEEAIDTLRPAADAKGIRVEAILDPSAGPISGDAERLQQVVWNLMSNAIKFAPKAGRVQVRLEAVNSHLEIVVEDDGPGIAPDFLPHVFERFRQADSSSTRVHKGLGLGLAIVRHLVELHGGRVHAANRPSGPGAVFTVILPRRPALGPQGRPGAVRHPLVFEGTLPAGPSLKGVHVMVVDDEDEARDLIGTALEQSGASVVKIASAAGVLHRLSEQRPHVLLADIEMPGQDGYALLREVRRMPPEQGGLTPAIAITAYASVEDRIRALSAGFDLHLPKPLQLHELRAAVARLAGQRR